MITVYLAGPDVFAKDAVGILKEKSRVLKRAGFKVITPLDNEYADATEIMNFNMRAIRQSDLILANLSPFRGTEPDSGTVFEVGVAVALNKPVHVYGVLDETYREHVNRFYKSDQNTQYCPRGLLIEDFGLPLNLMIATNVKFSRPNECFTSIVDELVKEYY